MLSPTGLFRSRAKAPSFIALCMIVASASAGCSGGSAPAKRAGNPHTGTAAASSTRGGTGGHAAGAHAGNAASAAAGSAANAGTDTSRARVAANPSVPPEVAQALSEWPLPGKDYNNSRYTRDSHIDSSNVSQLQEAWRVELQGLVFAYGMCSTVPLIAGGIVYIEDLSSSVRAIDLASGEVKWTVQDASLNPGPNGVALGWGKVFAIRGSDTVVAYDAATGGELWSKHVVDTATAGIDIQPVVFDGQVLVSTVPISTSGIYTGGDRGILKALDQATGEERWRFDTIDSSDDVWGNSGANSGGGSWFPPSIDLDSGRVFWAIANPAPFPGTADAPNGTSRPGKNLYTDTTLALDVRTGSYQWHHQTIEHDLFDRDLLHTLLTAAGDVPVVISTGKEGRVWANRRDTGEVLWGPVLVGMHMNDDLTELTGGTEVLPGSFGGVLTPPALAEGVVYVAALNAPTMYWSNQTAYFGSDIGTQQGELTALDVATGKVLWSTMIDGDPTGGATVVNDLVITATFQGTLYAYQRETGKEVWRWTAPGGINSWPSVSGDTIVVPVGSSNPAVVVALRLPGAATEGSVGTGGATGKSGAGGPASSANPNSFSAIYDEIISSRCAGALCHSSTSTGGSFSIGAGNASAVRATLLGRAASGSQCASSGLSLVVPGQPDASLLYLKLTDKPPCGSRMPLTAPLTADEVARFRAWIQDGAADD